MNNVPTSNFRPEKSEKLIGRSASPPLLPQSAARTDNSTDWKQLSWQKQLANSIRSAADLCEAVEVHIPEAIDSRFPVMVPESFVARMERGRSTDPLLRQVLATSSENVVTEGFSADPVQDANAKRAPGLLQKYHGRALLVTTGSCAVHCRYCFRRDYPYQAEPKTLDDWQPALRIIADDSSIREVILSGGDPLLLTDKRLIQLTSTLDDIPHVDRIRIHTRLPIVLPSRITSVLVEHLQSLRTQAVWVVHSNHANEIRFDCEQTLKLLVQSGFPVLNQAVLLKDINDDFVSLKNLCESLVNVGVMPYYLHQLDRVSGAGHFETDVETGRALIEQLKAVLPGYAVPKFVQEIAGRNSKAGLAT